MEQKPLLRNSVTQLAKKFPAFLRNPKIHYRVQRGRHRSLFWTTYNQSTTYQPIYHRSILISFS